jgi:hypothetical protein
MPSGSLLQSPPRYFNPVLVVSRYDEEGIEGGRSGLRRTMTKLRISSGLVRVAVPNASVSLVVGSCFCKPEPARARVTAVVSTVLSEYRDLPVSESATRLGSQT